MNDKGSKKFNDVPMVYERSQYQGLVLAANPCNPRNNRVSQSLILLVNRLGPAVMGLQFNTAIEDTRLFNLVSTLGFYIETDEPIYYGGNLGTNKLHFIHSLDWRGLSTIEINENLGVTSDISILSALSSGLGPQLYRACVGHWSWEVGVLNQQLDWTSSDQEYGWEATLATEDLVFHSGQGRRQWLTAIEQSGRQQVRSWFNRF